MKKFLLSLCSLSCLYISIAQIPEDVLETATIRSTALHATYPSAEQWDP